MSNGTVKRPPYGTGIKKNPTPNSDVNRKRSVLMWFFICATRVVYQPRKDAAERGSLLRWYMSSAYFRVPPRHIHHAVSFAPSSDPTMKTVSTVRKMKMPGKKASQGSVAIVV